MKKGRLSAAFGIPRWNDETLEVGITLAAISCSNRPPDSNVNALGNKLDGTIRHENLHAARMVTAGRHHGASQPIPFETVA